MTAAPARPLERPSTRGTALIWRAALIVVAAAAVAVSAPAAVRIPLSALAALAVLLPAARLRRRGALDGLLVAVGGSVVLLALTGLALNVLPVGLVPVAWGPAVGLLELAGLGLIARRDPAALSLPAVPGRRALRIVGWTALAGGVLAVSVGWAAASFQATHTAPLALAAEQHDGTSIVTVSSGTSAGPFRVDLVTTAGRRVLASGVTVAPGRSVAVAVPLAAGDRGLVQLVRPGAAAAVRELILDTSEGGR